MRILPQLDPRIKQALVAQRVSITKGLVCVALSAILTSLAIPLTKLAIEAIGNATAVGSEITREQPYEKELSKALGKPVDDIRRVFIKRSPDPRNLLPDAQAFSDELQVPIESAENALTNLPKKELEDRTTTNKRQDEAIHRLGLVCLAVVGLFAAKYWFTRGQAYYLSRAANRLAADLRIRLYEKLQRMPIAYFAKQRLGAIQSVLTNDVNVYQTAVMMIRDSIDGPFKAIGALVTILLIRWQLALVAILFIPVLAAFVQRNGQKMKKDQSQVQADLSDLNAVTNESLSGARVVKAFAAEDRMAAMYAEQTEKSFKSQMRAAKRFAQLRPMVELLGAVSLATILYICGHMARAGMLQISEIVALTFALDIINQGTRSLSNLNNTYNQVQAAAERIYSLILDVPEEALAQGGKKLDSVVGNVEFHNVGFQYPDGTWALHNVSFKLAAGTSLALVGPSGAGKSTLADLLLRFYDPSEGKITLDGIDIRELDLRWYREQFGVVPQQTFLFAGTIAENVRLGKGNASDDEVREALKLAHADGFVQNSSDGLLTMLGERGNRVSGGEGQRLAIARALVRKPRILLLDEATSNLDSESERAVTQALDEIMQERTTLFIAHRLTTAVRATTILVLRRGEVIEFGAPNELLESGGAFAAMYQSFTGGLMEDALG